MKRLVLILMILLCIMSYGQLNTAKLNIPSTPAFSILDFEPSAVMRPTSNKDLAADVLNSFDKKGSLLMNLGLEVSPYWLKSNSTLSREEYLNPDFKQTFVQSLSLSGATVKDSVSGNNQLGVGFRFKLFDGKPVASLQSYEQELIAQTTIISMISTARRMIGGEVNNRQDAIDVIVDGLIAGNISAELIMGFRAEAAETGKAYSDSPRDILLFLEKLIDDRTAENGQLFAKVAELQYERTGFILEFAGAGGFKTKNNREAQRVGVWVNASNYITPDDLFTLTARYMHQNSDTAENNFDVGLGFLKKGATYNISVEGMFRWYRAEFTDLNINNQPIRRLEKEITYRIAIQGSYFISKDISINLSIGKEFDSPFISRTGFFSILGLNYSIFNKQRVELPDPAP